MKNEQLIAVLERVKCFLADPVCVDGDEELELLVEVDSHLNLLTAQAALAPAPDGRPELLREACMELAATIHATGGLTVDDHGCDVPVADPEWLDLGAAYLLACEALGYEPQYAPGSEPDAVQPEPVPLRDMFPHPVRSDVVELEPDDPKATVCGTCGRGWDDTVSTSCTPTPSGRCPFEGEHEHTSEDAADSLELEVEMVAVFSTIHMPSSYPNFGEVSFDEFPEGFWVYVGTPEGLSGVVVPEWLRPLVAACHARDIRRLVFDCDGPQYDEFPQYDWDASAVCDEKEGG